MGQECKCRLDYEGRTFEGKALLETSELIFRGEARLKIPFKEMRRVKAADGKLHVEFGGREAAFHVGDRAGKWASKILNPPSRLDKLGIKDGMRLRWIGPLDAEFKAEAEGRGAAFVRSKAGLTFIAATALKDLEEISRVADEPVWVVYPKGVAHLPEIAVLKAGREAGRTDIKVASFSPTHTALKFVRKK